MSSSQINYSLGAQSIEIVHKQALENLSKAMATLESNQSPSANEFRKAVTEMQSAFSGARPTPSLIEFINALTLFITNHTNNADQAVILDNLKSMDIALTKFSKGSASRAVKEGIRAFLTAMIDVTTILTQQRVPVPTLPGMPPRDMTVTNLQQQFQLKK